MYCRAGCTYVWDRDVWGEQYIQEIFPLTSGWIIIHPSTLMRITLEKKKKKITYEGVLVLLNDQHWALEIKKRLSNCKKKEKNLKENKEKWHLLVDKCACWSELRWFADGLRYLNVKGLEAPAGYIHIQRALWACHGGKCALKKKKKTSRNLIGWLVSWCLGWSPSSSCG